MRLAADHAPPKDGARHTGVNSHQACGLAEFRVTASARRVAATLLLVKVSAESASLALTRGIAPEVPKSERACSAVSQQEAGTKDLRRSVEAAAEYRPCYTRLPRYKPDAKPGAPAEYRRRLWSGEVFALFTTSAAAPEHRAVLQKCARRWGRWEHNAVLGRWVGEADA